MYYTDSTATTTTTTTTTTTCMYYTDSTATSTLQLTDNLDDEIGFPLNHAPNYKRLTPAFVGRFIHLATNWFDDQVYLMSDESLIATLNIITKKHMGYMYPSLDSYGFEFIAGEIKERGGSHYLTMKSKLDQVVTVRPNDFFGCNYKLKGMSNDETN